MGEAEEIYLADSESDELRRKPSSQTRFQQRSSAFPHWSLKSMGLSNRNKDRDHPSKSQKKTEQGQQTNAPHRNRGTSTSKKQSKTANKHTETSQAEQRTPRQTVLQNHNSLWREAPKTPHRQNEESSRNKCKPGSRDDKGYQKSTVTPNNSISATTQTHFSRRFRKGIRSPRIEDEQIFAQGGCVGCGGHSAQDGYGGRGAHGVTFVNFSNSYDTSDSTACVGAAYDDTKCRFPSKSYAKGNHDGSFFLEFLLDLRKRKMLRMLKLGWNLRTSFVQFLMLWTSTNDPYPGEFSLRLDIHWLPQFVTSSATRKEVRSGFSGILNFQCFITWYSSQC
ncbi:hypothetical protein Q3G72_029954 [Acer saccharum]|nr:hypothetical protein Q3G72_029954 [Acer saccharum]